MSIPIFLYQAFLSEGWVSGAALGSPCGSLHPCFQSSKLPFFSNTLQYEEAATVSDLADAISNSYTPAPVVELLTDIPDWKNMLEKVSDGQLQGHSVPHVMK